MVKKIDSNVTGFAFAEEQSLGVLPGTPIWRALEPNSYGDVGADSPTVARNVINPSRQVQKGAVVGHNAGAAFGHDFLLTALNRLLRSFFFAKYREKPDTQGYDTTNVAVSAVSGTQYTFGAGPVFLATHLVLASGFSTAANNGLKAATAATATTISAAGLVAEAAPPAAARLTAVGVRGAAADIAFNVTGGVPALTSTALNFTTLGLAVGEWVYLGDDTVANRFANNVGFARVSAIAAAKLTFDLTTWTPATEAGTGKTISIFFGKFLRNEKDPALIVQKSVQFERQLGVNDSETGSGALQQSEYVVGALGNELTLNMPMEDKLTIDLSFLALRGEERDSATGPKAGTRVAVVDEDAINTTVDLAFSKLYLTSAASGNSAPTGLFGYLESAGVTINNGLTPNKALGVKGAFDVSAGDFTVGGDVNPYFTSMAAVSAVRQNSECGAYMGFCKANAGFVFDLPSMTLTGGRAQVVKDQPIMLPVSQGGHEHNTLGFTLGYTHFPYLPTLAMPAA